MTDLEQRLRATLHERSGDITAVPPHLLEDAPRRGRPRWMLPVAAAAVVLVVAGIVLAVRARDRHDSARPAGPSCVTDLPDAWRTAIDDGALKRADDDQPLAMLPNGTMIVRENGADPLNPGPIDEIIGDGTRSTLLVPASDTFLSALAYAVGSSHVVLVLSSTGDSMTGPVTPGLYKTIYLVDTTTGDHVLIADTPAPGFFIGGVAVLGDTVYYDYHPEEAANGDTVQAYDVTEARHRVLYRGPVGGVGTVHGTALGVDWGSGSIDAELPANVKSALTPDAVTDGTAYAAVGQGGIVWADRDGTVRGPFDQQAATAPVVDGVAGPYVFFHDDDASADLYVLDTRTNAVAATGLQHRSAMPSGGGYIAMSQPARRIDTNDLPGLDC